MKSLRADDPTHSVGSLCGLFGHTKQAFYQSEKREFKDKSEDQVIVEIVRDIRTEMPRIGTRKLQQILEHEYGVKCGRDRLFRILGDEFMLVRQRHRRPRTTNSGHPYPVYPNIIASITPERPNHVWVSDITYIRVDDRFVYLFLVTDMFSRKIVGWSLADDMSASHAVEALRMALRQRKGKGVETIHHSDRGTQYCCAEYVSLLRKNNIVISMTENGDPRENAYAERVNGTIKNEFLKPLKPTREKVRDLVKFSISTYNDKRPHFSLMTLTDDHILLTPSAAHAMTEEFGRGWKNYPWYSKRDSEKSVIFAPDTTQGDVSVKRQSP